MPQPMSVTSLKLIQKCLSLVPVIVLGSGASAAYGFAGMPQLADHLVNHVVPDPKEQDRWLAFRTAIASGLDLENALHQVDLSSMLEQQVVQATRQLLLQQDISLMRRMQRGELALPLGVLLQFLSRTAKQKIKIVTTNYDRLAEYAADQVRLRLDNGYCGQYEKHFQGFSRFHAPQIELMKVHGSLDWFRSGDGAPVSLPDHAADACGMSPLMVTPGVRKYELTHQEPFRSMIAKADEAFANASAILCVGYGFHDNHIHLKLVERMRQGKTPILIATKRLSDSALQFIRSAPTSAVLGLEEYDQGTRIVYLNSEEIVEGASLWSLDALIQLVL
ncbi:hypothetical protein DUZ99_07630 [Xylanibacillus composti]|uniref:SIR2-like domain-containing protein n=1 Tax=Xylanibacillus composti TaxID=1572762 RepID=A0A8J4H3X6_9BACL|nr:SIR2 family protein [Xylanibacillus composti]MDT9724863.1 hypothetical protein [Xylanibacillus composti]GIQ69042.1 hypothetical protein XYCOK13_18660 [Xylanibacillus composti]